MSEWPWILVLSTWHSKVPCIHQVLAPEVQILLFHSTTKLFREIYPWGPVKCGHCKHVVFIYRWSLEQVWSYPPPPKKKYQQEALGPWRSAWEATWPFAKVPEVAHILHFYLRGRSWAYFHSMSSSFRETWRFSKLPYLFWIFKILSFWFFRIFFRFL